MEKCPHGCTATLIVHEGTRVGFFHCNECGCCFDGATGNVRDGHPACAKSINFPVAAVVEVVTEPVVVEEEVIVDNEPESTVVDEPTPSRRR